MVEKTFYSQKMKSLLYVSILLVSFSLSPGLMEVDDTKSEKLTSEVTRFKGMDSNTTSFFQMMSMHCTPTTCCPLSHRCCEANTWCCKRTKKRFPARPCSGKSPIWH